MLSAQERQSQESGGARWDGLKCPSIALSFGTADINPDLQDYLLKL